jgi:hypothetical protein
MAGVTQRQLGAVDIAPPQKPRLLTACHGRERVRPRRSVPRLHLCVIPRALLAGEVLFDSAAGMLEWTSSCVPGALTPLAAISAQSCSIRNNESEMRAYLAPMQNFN